VILFNSEIICVESPSVFLSRLATNLKDSEEIDQDLTEILVETILSPSPGPDCVKKASNAIATLAGNRAHPGEGENGK